VKRAGASLALFVLLLGGAVPAATAAPSPEQRQRQIDAEVRRLRDQLGDTAEEEARLVAEVEVSRRLRRELDARAAELDTAIAGVQAELSRIDGEFGVAVQREAEAQAAVAAAKRELAEAREVLRQQAVSAFINFGRELDVDELITDVQDRSEAHRLEAYVDAVAERQEEVVERLRRIQEDTTVLEAEAAAAKQGVAAQQQAVTAQKAALEAARAEQAAAQAEAANEVAIEQRLLAQVQARRTEYQKRINALERESASVEAELRRRQAGQAIKPSGKGVFVPPTASAQITSAYGWRVHPIYGDRRLHAGIDLRASTGSTVLAAGGGTVAFAGWRSGYGNTVIVDHGGATATLYAHNSVISVSVGQTVTRGQKIAAAGSTGNSTGPHVHFEVRVNGTPVDPMKYL
jgi:murein DD-endopeptidase MepM/ murein hydrolase activator NlpD